MNIWGWGDARRRRISGSKGREIGLIPKTDFFEKFFSSDFAFLTSRSIDVPYNVRVLAAAVCVDSSLGLVLVGIA
jgi:hypothetical protein